MAGKPENRYQQQRLAVIRAAAAEFAANGYHGASTKAIAERVGIKQGSLYYYVKSKEAALADVCLHAIDDYVGRLDAIVALRQPFATRLLAIFQSHLSAFREKRDAMKVYLDERLYLPETARTELHALGSGYRQKLEALFERAVADGELRPDADCHFAALTVIGIGNAWGELIVRDPSLDIVALAPKCTDLVLRGLAADGA